MITYHSLTVSQHSGYVNQKFLLKIILLSSCCACAASITSLELLLLYSSGSEILFPYPWQCSSSPSVSTRIWTTSNSSVGPCSLGLLWAALELGLDLAQVPDPLEELHKSCTSPRTTLDCTQSWFNFFFSFGRFVFGYVNLICLQPELMYFKFFWILTYPSLLRWMHSHLFQGMM